MERSHFLAKLIGPVCIAGGLGMLFNTAIYRAMFERALHDHMLIYLSGVIALTIGLAIVILHNDWKWHWPLIITVFGWMAVIGGIVRMIAPQVVEFVRPVRAQHAEFFCHRRRDRRAARRAAELFRLSRSAATGHARAAFAFPEEKVK